MNLLVQYKLKSNPTYLKFLRENSNWYKYLNRNQMFLKKFEKEMKVKYKMTPKDKLERFTENIDKVSQIIDIFS
ncbi:MAG: YlbE-like family protein [Bacilli bacterium]